ncbi:MAG: hypothetical protein WDO73_03180 [Ignavibacteriota bacterium]
MRVLVVCLLCASAAWPQFRGSGQLVVAPTTIKDSKGRMVDGLDPSDLILYDNNVLRPIQADMALFPISLVVVVESNEHSKAVLDKLGSSGILFSQLLAADQGETALLSFSNEVTQLVDFTSDPDDLTPRAEAHETGWRRRGRARRLIESARHSVSSQAGAPPGRPDDFRESRPVQRR